MFTRSKKNFFNVQINRVIKLGVSSIILTLLFTVLMSVTNSFAEMETKGENLIPNPGFENASSSNPKRPEIWGTNWSVFNINTFWAREEAHTGKYCVGISNTKEGTGGYYWSFNAYIPVKGDTTYKFSFWAKCPKTSSWGVLPTVYFYDKDKKFPPKDGEPRGNWWIHFGEKEPFDYWRKFSRLHKTPKDARYLSGVVLSLHKCGVIYYDDISFVEVESVEL